MKRNRFLSFFLAGLMLFSFLSVSPNDSFSPFTMMEANAAEGRLYNQNDSYWKTVTFTKYASFGNSMCTSGCGIFSFCNAIYVLNGSQIDAKSLATWAVDNGSYQPGNGGLYRKAFYDTIQAGYGSSYGFKIDGQYDGTISDSRLITHLQNGGVAVIHVSNHFMAVTGYNASNGTYHVIESAVSSGRGLQADSWVTASKLSSGSTDVDWYALISSTELTAPNILTNIQYYVPNSTISIRWTTHTAAQGYWVDVWKDGEHVTSESVGFSSSYEIIGQKGMYEVAISACKDNSSLTNTYSFCVQELTAPVLSTNHFSYIPDSIVDITWSPVEMATSYWIDIYKDGKKYVSEQLVSTTHYESIFDSGEYEVYVAAVNSTSGWNTAISDVYTFYVIEPTILDIQPGDSLHDSVFSWTANNNVLNYNIRIWKDRLWEGESYYSEWSLTDTSCEVNLPAGIYYAYVDAIYENIVVMSNVVEFQMNSDAASYTVAFNANGGYCDVAEMAATYDTTYGALPEATRDGYTFLGWFTAADGGTEVTASTTVTTNKNHTLYAHWEKNKVVGDVNADGTFNVADVVMLQKWLICTPNATLIDWQTADMCDDDIINVLDLCLMKRELLYRN